ncbi:hypothetical protein [Orenia marismortui]|uniref:Uncharacterized protein n=1 Tax=Orenia marismortui TaxID=46469 RepID=A0A4R8GM40_9FIRM|nr:hypothetical protein [Orenia marismortui]TDX46756.1 hypothetical protein C7959_13713 [Orenia marismortui]
MLLKSNWKEKKKLIATLNNREYIIKENILKEYGFILIILIGFIFLEPFLGRHNEYEIIQLLLQSSLIILSFIILGVINGIFELYVSSILENENNIDKLKGWYIFVYMINLMIIPVILKLMTIEKTIRELLIYSLIIAFIGIFFSNFSWEDLEEEIYNSE